ncbi:MAG: peptidyl-prolyl cis-trans isomerase [Acidobacteria bacterium]|nr:peptidyl-prolyl cis-trans isomerase [Acidobacteriota bacterium]
MKTSGGCAAGRRRPFRGPWNAPGWQRRAAGAGGSVLSAARWLLPAILVVSCAPWASPPPDPARTPALRIDDRTVPVSAWERYRSTKKKLEPQQDDRGLFDLFAEQQLFLYLADRDRVEVDEEDVRENLTKLGLTQPEDLNNKALLRSVRDDLRVQKWIKASIASRVSVSAKEAEAYYRQNAEQFVQPEAVHLREILLSDPVFADRLYRQLRKQPMEEFFQAARKYSRAPSAPNEGELGFFARGDLPAEFERAVFGLRPGEISRPVKSDLGYHLFLVEERLRRHRRQFSEVQDEIFERLLAEKERGALASYLEDVRKTIRLQVYVENLNLPEQRQESQEP